MTELRRVDVRSQRDVDKWLSARQFRADYVPLLQVEHCALPEELLMSFERGLKSQSQDVEVSLASLAMLKS